jgi:hypothetical protein
MRSYNTFENNELKYQFILSEKEAYILRLIMCSDVLRNKEDGYSSLRNKVCMDIIRGVDEGYDKYREEIRSRDWEIVEWIKV